MILKVIEQFKLRSVVVVVGINGRSCGSLRHELGARNAFNHFASSNEVNATADSKRRSRLRVKLDISTWRSEDNKAEAGALAIAEQSGKPLVRRE